MPGTRRAAIERRRQQAQLMAWSVVLKVSAIVCWVFGSLLAIGEAIALARGLRAQDVQRVLEGPGMHSSRALKSGEVLLVVGALVFGLVLVFIIGAVLMGLAHALRSLVRLERQTFPEEALRERELPEGPYSMKEPPRG